MSPQSRWAAGVFWPGGGHQAFGGGWPAWRGVLRDCGEGNVLKRGNFLGPAFQKTVTNSRSFQRWVFAPVVEMLQYAQCLMNAKSENMFWSDYNARHACTSLNFSFFYSFRRVYHVTLLIFSLLKE